MSWKVDYAHTHIGFSVRHMMLSTLRGQFEKYTLTAQIDENEIDRIQAGGVLTDDDVLNSNLLVQIEAASINTREADRDAHLRSPDFLNADMFPYVTFKAKRAVRQDKTHGQLIGALTIRDVTKEVALDVEFLGQATTPWGGTSVGFEGHTKIYRKDWMLTWNVSLETGGWLVGDEIRIDIEIEFVKVAEPVKQVAEPVEQVAELVTA